MNEVTIIMPYIGKVLSVNHYRGRRRDGGEYVKSETRDWMEELGWKIKMYHIEDWSLPLHVTCSGVFKDKRSTPDLSNLSKVILDAIEETTGINDVNYRWHDGTISYGEPELVIEIKEEK